MLCSVITFVPGVERLTFNRVQSFDLLRPQSTPSCSILPSPASTSGIYSSSSSIHSSIFDLNRPYLTSALKEKLAWGFRYKVALGTTKGLLYLHEVWQRRIVHRDIKAANILLTQDFEPHICDFWLAKWLLEHWTHHTVSRFEGTFRRNCCCGRTMCVGWLIIQLLRIAINKNCIK